VVFICKNEFCYFILLLMRLFFVSNDPIKASFTLFVATKRKNYFINVSLGTNLKFIILVN